MSLNPAHGEVYLIQHYVIMFVSDLQQISVFIRVLLFPPPENWPPWYNWNTVESDIKHHNPYSNTPNLFLSILISYFWQDKNLFWKHNRLYQKLQYFRIYCSYTLDSVLQKKFYYNNYTPATPERGILFYLCLSFRPSKKFFVAFFSATIDGRNLIFGHKLQSYRYAILWEAFLDPSDSYFLFADLVGFYTHWTYMRGYQCSQFILLSLSCNCVICVLIKGSNKLSVLFSHGPK